MKKVSQEKEYFEKTFKTINKILAVPGLQLDENDINRTVLQRLRLRLFFIFNYFFFLLGVILEIAWLINSILTNRKFVEITYFMPCLTLCFLGIMKSFSFLYSAHHVNDIPISLRKLQAISFARRTYRDEVEEDLLKHSMPMLNLAIYALWILNMVGLALFLIGPLIITGYIYFETGRVQLVLPFLLWYPFDAVNVKIWPFTYCHQVWSANTVVHTVMGPDVFFALSCTFIHVQFKCLQYDIERIHVRNRESDRNESERFTLEFKEIIERHNELIRCVQLLEKIYTKSTLFNAVTSSFIICATGFNVTTIDNIILMTPFIAFLAMGLIQIYLFCYYGDVIMKISTAVSTAVYNSHWYRADARAARGLLLISIRSRRACRLTACDYADINLNTFCRNTVRLMSTVANGFGQNARDARSRKNMKFPYGVVIWLWSHVIVGTAWSYFTLLKTAYK